MHMITPCAIILAIPFIGEMMNDVKALPVPASIYGLVLMLLCLHFGIVHIDSVKDSGKFLIEIMPLMFIPAAVGLIESWKTIGSKIGTYLIITVLSTIFVMIVAGHTTQAFIRFSKSKDNQERKDS